MEERELDFVVTAKWIDEDGKEYEKNIQINDITHQQSIVIELKTVENVPVIEERKEEQIKFPSITDNMDRRGYVDMFPQMLNAYQLLKKPLMEKLNAYQFLKKPWMEKQLFNNVLHRQRMSAYYRDNMQTYWDYECPLDLTEDNN